MQRKSKETRGGGGEEEIRQPSRSYPIRSIKTVIRLVHYERNKSWSFAPRDKPTEDIIPLIIPYSWSIRRSFKGEEWINTGRRGGGEGRGGGSTSRQGLSLLQSTRFASFLRYHLCEYDNICVASRNFLHSMQVVAFYKHSQDDYLHTNSSPPSLLLCVPSCYTRARFPSILPIPHHLLQQRPPPYEASCIVREQWRKKGEAKRRRYSNKPIFPVE